MATMLVDGKTGNKFSDLRSQAHTYERVPENRIAAQDLEGVPFVIESVQILDSQFDEGRKYVKLYIVTENDEEGVLVNSGAAIIPQLDGQAFPLYVPGGLMLSRNGKTWRLDFAGPNPEDFPV